MPRIEPKQNPSSDVQETLEGLHAKLGRVPNIFQTFAHSPAVLDFYMQGSKALSKTSISAKLRESLALTLAGLNGCDYCASAHTKIGEGAGLSVEELALNLHGQSEGEKTQAALTFAKILVENHGHTSDADVDALRQAGYEDAEILEIIAVVAFNIFTNFFNDVVQTEIDFPEVSTKDIKQAA